MGGHWSSKVVSGGVEGKVGLERDGLPCASAALTRSPLTCAPYSSCA
jgi:hypothetical protein